MSNASILMQPRRMDALPRPTHKAVQVAVVRRPLCGPLCGSTFEPIFLTEAPEEPLSPNGPVTCQDCIDRMFGVVH